jgi:hypothetical protein
MADGPIPMRPVAFGEPLLAGTRLTLFSDDKPDRFFTVIKFWMDETSGVALALKTETGKNRGLKRAAELILLYCVPPNRCHAGFLHGRRSRSNPV